MSITDQAIQYVGYLGIQAQAEGESDRDFVGRVAGTLSDNGKLIESHEVLNNARFDSEGQGGENVMTGLLGAAAMAMQGKDYGSTGERRVDDEFAAGVVSQAPKTDPAMALLAMMLFGGGRD